ncbi:MAG: tetratricopeptide repeat protein [Acidobacteria bacterium]|nr:tetratricopeptide repeat protein [Acidobacteriota bacterium]
MTPREGARPPTGRLAKALAARDEAVRRLHTAADALDDASRKGLDVELSAVFDACVDAFRAAWLESSRIAAALEIARTLAIRLTLVHNYSVDPTSDLRLIASRLAALLDAASEHHKLTADAAEAAYLRGVLLLHAGEREDARLAFEGALQLASHATAERVDYGSCLLIAQIAHEEGDWSDSIRYAEKAAKLASSTNLAAQALAVVGLSRHARGDRARALHKLEDALRFFDPSEPLFNPYYFRNTILFCGIVALDMGDVVAAERYFRRALEVTSADSYDAFDAHARLGRVLLMQRREREAAAELEKALATYHFAECEPVVDVLFELGTLYAALGDTTRARPLLHRVLTSDIAHPGKGEASRLLGRAVIG